MSEIGWSLFNIAFWAVVFVAAVHSRMSELSQPRLDAIKRVKTSEAAFGDVLEGLKPNADARCLAVAKTKLEFATMFANHAIFTGTFDDEGHKSLPDHYKPLSDAQKELMAEFKTKTPEFQGDPRAVATAKTFFQEAGFAFNKAVANGDFTKEPATDAPPEYKPIGDKDADLLNWLYAVQAKKQVDGRLMALAITNTQSAFMWGYYAST